MDRRLVNIIIALVAVIVIFLLVSLIGGAINENLTLANTGLLRFVFTAIGLVIVFIVYYVTRASGAWDVGTREVVYMAIGAALYAVFSFLFNGTVFTIPSVSQVALRPAIVIPMFFGYFFGPTVGFFTGAVGNMFGDALTGFSLSPQWSVGNGLVGLIAGMAALFSDKRRSMNVVLIISAVLATIGTLMYAFNSDVTNEVFFWPYGDPVSALAGVSVVIGFLLVILVRFVFGKNVDVAAAVMWSMLGNLIGIGFAALSDIAVNGYTPAVAIVGEFLPAAGPNLIFAAILVPILVAAYSAMQQQTGR